MFGLKNFVGHPVLENTVYKKLGQSEIPQHRYKRSIYHFLDFRHFEALCGLISYGSGSARKPMFGMQIHVVFLFMRSKYRFIGLDLSRYSVAV